MIHHRRAPLTVALTAALAASAAADQPFDTFSNGSGELDDFTYSPDGAQIAYLADADTPLAFEIFAKPIGDIAPAPKITGNLAAPAQAEPFRYTPDGTSIVYVAEQDTLGTKEIYVAPAEGGPGTRLNGPLPPGGQVNPLADRTFAITSDSSRVVYLASERDAETNELWVVDIASPGQSRRISDTLTADGDVTDFLITPDDATVIYLADQAEDEVPELWRVSIDGGSATRLSGDLESGMPALVSVQTDFRLSADGARVVYRADQEIDAIPSLSLYSAPLNGGGSIHLSEQIGSEVAVRSFRISPTSERVAYWADAGVNEPAELYVTPIDQMSGSRRINTDLPEDSQVEPDYRFTDDGNFLVYRADQRLFDQEELYTAPADGSQGPARISRDLTVGGEVSAFALAGLRVVYRATSDDLTATELYSVPVTGGINRRLGTGAGSVGLFEVASGNRGVFIGESTVDGATREERVVRHDALSGPPSVIANFTSDSGSPASLLSLHPSPSNEGLVAYIATRPDPQLPQLWIAESALFADGFDAD